MPSEKVSAKLQTLPAKPGVYLMRDRRGKIIYIGKAVSLRNRVRSYFQKGSLRSAPPKLRGLIRSIDDFDFLVVRSEAEALLTEGRLIKEYRPRYNVDFKDDKRFLLLRIDLNEPFPRFQPARIRKNDGATYFGPYVNSLSAREAVEFCERHFGLRRCPPREPGPADYRHCMNDIIRFCSAPCIGRVSREGYLERVAEACAFLRGERPQVLAELEAQMRAAAEEREYERAAALRDTLHLLREAVRQRARGTSDIKMKNEDAVRGVEALREHLKLAQPPRIIECFDISNISGTYAVGSMVCAEDGMPNRKRYRLFRIKTVEGIDDPAMMAEVIRRRYSRVLDEERPLPDLVLVDGGITQLRAAQAELKLLGLESLPVAGLAKRYEEIISERPGMPRTLRLPRESPALKVLQRIRDEAHRFALTYHRRLRGKRIRESSLDDIPGVGEKRKLQLLQHLGSIDRIRRASAEEIAGVPGIGESFAQAIFAHLHAEGKPSS